MKQIIYFAVLYLVSSRYINNILDFNYHNYDQMKDYLTRMTHNYPNNTLLYSIGNSTEGRPLLVIAISSISPLTFQDFDKYKNVKLIANIHGDEAVGRELLLHFISFALDPSNDSDSISLRSTLNNTILHILPSLNPDGFEMALNSTNHEWRENKNYVDLNRNYPDFFETNNVIIQPETHAIIKWLQTFNFMLSVSFHGGAVVVSYPYDNKNPTKDDNYNPSDDDDVFTHLAHTYASNVKYSYPCDPSEYFNDGITNGAKWYPVKGGMQDYNYINGVFELTIELSCQKFPPANLLPYFWKTNHKAIVKLLEEAQKGVEGTILYSDGKAVPNAAIFIDNRLHPVYTNKHGKFWRMLRPNTYILTVQDNNCPQESYQITVPSPKLDGLVLRLKCATKFQYS